MTEQEIDKLQEFIESNLHSDVPNEIYNKIMLDAQSMETMDQFNKTWDKYLQDHSTGWKDIKVNTDPLSKQVAETFKDNFKPSDNWIYENFPGVDPNLVKEELVKLSLEKEKADKAKKELAERYVRQKAVDDYQHSYFGMSKDNLANKALNWLADLVISDDTKRSIVEDPNNTSGIVGNAAVDIGGTGLDFLPGWGQLAGPVARTGRDLANGKDLSLSNAIDFGVAGLGAKMAKGLKAKGVSDDAIDQANKLSEIAPKYEEVYQIDKAVEKAVKNKEAIAKSVPELTRDSRTGLIESMKPEDWAEYVYSFKNNPDTYEFLKSLGYENRTMIKEALKSIEKSNQKLVNDKALLAEQFVKEHNIKYPLYKGVREGSVQIAPGLAHQHTKLSYNTDYKTNNPEKAKLKTERDVIDWAKEQFSRQWEAGFKPKDGILLKAWEEWNNEH